MTFLKVSGNMGATRFSKGKLAGALIMAMGAYGMIVPYLNGLLGWSLPTPAPDTADRFTGTLDSLYAFLEGLGIFGVRAAIK